MGNGARSGNPGMDPARDRGSSGSPDGDIDPARGRGRRRPGAIGPANRPGGGDIVAARGRFTTLGTARGGGGGVARSLRTGGASRPRVDEGAAAARAGVHARTTSTVSVAPLTSLGSKPTVCMSTLRSKRCAPAQTWLALGWPQRAQR
jgi:hypothetical protein